jgi:hypothetical protein
MVVATARSIKVFAEGENGVEFCCSWVKARLCHRALSSTHCYQVSAAAPTGCRKGVNFAHGGCALHLGISSFRCFSDFTPFLLLPVVVYMDDGVWRDWDQEHVDRDAVACGAPEGRQSFVLREMGEITGLEQPEEDGIVVQRDRR